MPLWASHAHRRLVEPLCGGLVVTLGLNPERTRLNDADPHLINFYRWLRKGMRTGGVPMENSEALYCEHRTHFNALLRAGRTVRKRRRPCFTT